MFKKWSVLLSIFIFAKSSYLPQSIQFIAFRYIKYIVFRLPIGIPIPITQLAPIIFSLAVPISIGSCHLRCFRSIFPIPIAIDTSIDIVGRNIDWIAGWNISFL